MTQRTPQEVVARLERFAARRGPDGVARAMRMFGIKGSPRSPYACPLACYLGRATGQQACVTPGDIELRPVTGTDFTSEFYHSPATDPFVRMFDQGDYPDLIDPEYMAPTEDDTRD